MRLASSMSRVAAMSASWLWLCGCAAPTVRPDDMAVDIVSRDANTVAKIRARSREEATFVRNQ